MRLINFCFNIVDPYGISGDSVSLLRFPFLRQVQLFLCEISLVYRLKYPYSCFSFHFCFLVIVVLLLFVLSMLLLVIVISSSLHFFMKLSICPIDVSKQFSMLAIPLPLPFLDTCSLSVSSLRCKSLRIIIRFLVLWFICLSSSLFQPKNGPEYLIRGIAQVVIPVMRFLLYSSVSSSFLFLLRYF